MEHTDHRGKCGCPGDTYWMKIEYLVREGRHEEAEWLLRWLHRVCTLMIFVDVSYQHKDLPEYIIRKAI